MLTIDLEWDVSASTDVASQVVHVIIAGAPEPDVTLPPDASKHTITVNDGAAVEWWVTTTDDAGNSTDMDPHRTFVASDTLPPAPATNPRETVTGEA